MNRLIATVWLLVCVTAAVAQDAAPPQGERGPKVPAFTIRPGYKVTLAAEELKHARFMEFDDKGRLFVSQIRAGEVWRLEDKDGDGFFETRKEHLRERPFVHGLQWVDGWLWVTTPTSVLRCRDTNDDGVADEIVTVVADLQGAGGHLYRPILVTPEGFYTHVGDTGNINDETSTDRQKIWFYSLDGKTRKLFASGLRNTEKLRFRPGTREVWGMDHGSDNFGGHLGEKPPNRQPVTDLHPPDELNHYVEGGFYGHPFITGNRIPRYEYRDRRDILDLAAQTIPPAWSFGAHWSANSFTFVSLENAHFPADHRGDLFAACRGSWNSSVRVGYRIERVRFDPWTGRPFGGQMIVGTLADNGNEVLARPVDCAEAPDGTILWTCDFTNRIYRIAWVGTK